MTDPHTPEQFREKLYSHKHSLHQLRMMVQRVTRDQRAEALLGVFSDPSRGYREQNVAGDLLLELLPQPRQSLDEILTATAASWNVSVEQLPFFLRDVFGREAVIEAAERLAKQHPAESRETRALETVGWWLSGRG